ncbi:hypothetical protein AB0C21_05985 [Spirillospora sp. NPDC049024]
MYFVLGNSAKDPDRAVTLMLLTVTMAAFGAMDAVLNSGIAERTRASGGCASLG